MSCVPPSKKPIINGSTAKDCHSLCNLEIMDNTVELLLDRMDATELRFGSFTESVLTDKSIEFPQFKPSVRYNGESYMLSEAEITRGSASHQFENISGPMSADGVLSLSLFNSKVYQWLQGYGNYVRATLEERKKIDTTKIDEIPAGASAIKIFVQIRKSGRPTDGTAIIEDIITNAPTKQCNVGEYTNPSEYIKCNASSSFSLSALIPKGAHYIYKSCADKSGIDGMSNIVFTPESAITIGLSASKKLEQIIGPTVLNKTKIIASDAVFRSANANSVSGDDIYIDCQPVGADGEVLIPQPKSALGVGGPDIQKLMQNPFIIAILAAIGMLLFIIIGKKALNWFTAAKAARAAKKAAKAAAASVQSGGLFRKK